MTEAKIKKLKSDFRKNMKENFGSCYIDRNVSRVGFDYMRSYYLDQKKGYILAQVNENILYLTSSINSHNDNSIIKSLFVIDNFWLEYAKINNYDAVVVNNHFGKDINEKFIELGFEVSDSENAKFFRKYYFRHSSELFCKILNKDVINKKKKMTEALFKKLDNLTKANPTISCNIVYHGIENPLYLRMYYEGKNLELKYSFDESNIFKIKLEEQRKPESGFSYSVEIKEEDKLEADIEDLFKKLDNNVKLKNLFSYPTRFYDDFSSRNLGFLNQEKKKELLNHLRTFYKPKDIEIYFAELDGNKFNFISHKVENWGWKGFYMFKLLDKYITYNIDGTFKFFNDKKEAANNFKKLYLNYNSEIIDKVINKQIENIA